MFKNRKGFTLIELLIVVVIIGILAAIAIPKFANTKEKAIIASMKSDLRNMVTAQEAHFSDFGTYATSIAAAQASGVAAFVPSQGNAVTTGLATPAGGTAPTGWNAQATNPLTTQVCNIGGNGVTFANSSGVQVEGAPVCA